jgi:predicted phosphoadenosine phosphosulfate sulfurtransferase
VKTLDDYAGEPCDDDGPRVMRKKKIYSDVNVLDAARARLEYLFEHFDNICFAVSGGKDSGTTVQLGNEIAAKLGKTFSIMYIDLEAMYMATERFVRAIREITRPNCKAFYWI